MKATPDSIISKFAEEEKIISLAFNSDIKSLNKLINLSGQAVDSNSKLGDLINQSVSYWVGNNYSNMPIDGMNHYVELAVKMQNPAAIKALEKMGKELSQDVLASDDLNLTKKWHDYHKNQIKIHEQYLVGNEKLLEMHEQAERLLSVVLPDPVSKPNAALHEALSKGLEQHRQSAKDIKQEEKLKEEIIQHHHIESVKDLIKLYKEQIKRFEASPEDKYRVPIVRQRVISTLSDALEKTYDKELKKSIEKDLQEFEKAAKKDKSPSPSQSTQKLFDKTKQEPVSSTQSVKSGRRSPER
jgi:hypothetical protein